MVISTDECSPVLRVTPANFRNISLAVSCDSFSQSSRNNRAYSKRRIDRYEERMAGSHCSADRSVPRAFAQSHRRKNTYVRRVHTQLAHALPPGHMARTVPLFSSGGEETRGLRRVLKIPTTSSSLHNTRFPRVLLAPSVALFPSLVGPNSPPWRRPLKPALRPAV